MQPRSSLLILFLFIFEILQAFNLFIVHSVNLFLHLAPFHNFFTTMTFTTFIVCSLLLEAEMLLETEGNWNSIEFPKLKLKLCRRRNPSCKWWWQSGFHFVRYPGIRAADQTTRPCPDNLLYKKFFINLKIKKYVK